MNDWIDVNDQFPTAISLCLRDRKNAVLVYTPSDDMIRVAWYLGKDWRNHHEWIIPSAKGGYRRLQQTVTHWTFLPEVS